MTSALGDSGPPANATRRTVLVLGVGGFVGQGIIEALAESAERYWIEAACVSPRSAGLYLADAAQISPYARDPNFVPWLIRTCRERKVDIVLSGQEDVLEIMAANRERVQREVAAMLCVDSLPRLHLTRDKLRMNTWLASHGYDTADTITLNGPAADVRSFVASHPPPWVCKPRFGRGSRGVTLVHTEREVYNSPGGEELLLQEYLPDDGREHTVAVLSDRTGTVVGSVAFERTLTSGTTTWARPMLAGAESQRAAESICSRLSTTGPCNLQFRHRASGRPVCMDVNLRFSSTVAIRASFGFNDVDAAVRLWLGGGDIKVAVGEAGGVALRRMMTIRVDDASFRALVRGGRVEFSPPGDPDRGQDRG